jgi:hypothetical protein
MIHIGYDYPLSPPPPHHWQRGDRYVNDNDHPLDEYLLYYLLI